MKSNGGLIFPQTKTTERDSTIWHDTTYSDVQSTGGMSLLEHYAGLAMQSIITNSDIFDGIAKISSLNKVDSVEAMAHMAFTFAEAMVAEREKRLAELKPEA